MFAIKQTWNARVRCSTTILMVLAAHIVIYEQ